MGLIGANLGSLPALPFPFPPFGTWNLKGVLVWTIFRYKGTRGFHSNVHRRDRFIGHLGFGRWPSANGIQV